VTFTEAGCYDLTYIGTTVNGCLIQQTLNNIVCVNPTPQAKFTYGSGIPTIFNNSLNFYDASEGAVSYQWNFVGFGGSSLQNPTYTFLNVQPDEEVMVCEEVISDLGCSDTSCQIIRFQDELIIHVPNAFTPDGTEFNNTFYPVFQSEVKLEEYKFQVYNRWGEVVFSTNDYKEAWDGTYKGLLCPSGTYVWVIELRDGYQEIQQRFTGSVSMLY
jgi:gliding motility-associated-like protein